MVALSIDKQDIEECDISAGQWVSQNKAQK